MSRDYSEIVKDKLKLVGLPTTGWCCLDVEDTEDDGFTCELCGNTRVRFVHHMVNLNTGDELAVGCICAGAMEGNLEAAKNREKDKRNKAKRKRNFPNRKWKTAKSGSLYLNHEKGTIFINHTRHGGYGVCFRDEKVWSYRNFPIRDFTTACYAAFDLVEEW